MVVKHKGNKSVEATGKRMEEGLDKLLADLGVSKGDVEKAAKRLESLRENGKGKSRGG